MTKYVAAKLSDEIKATKADVESAVEGKYPDASVVLSYTAELPSGDDVGSRVGDIVDFRMDDTASQFLKCDGSSIQKASYPELAAHLEGKVTTIQAILGNSLVNGVTPLNNNCWDVSFSPDGMYLATAHSGTPTMTVYNTSTWDWISGTPVIGGTANVVRFSPDSTLLAIGQQNSPYFTVLNVPGWSEVSGTPSFSNSIQGISFSPNGEYIAIVGGDGLFVYRVSDWSLVHSELSVTPSVVEFSPNSQYLAFSDSDVFVLNTSDWSNVLMPAGAESLAAPDLAFSPNGEYLAIVNNGAPGLTVIDTYSWTVFKETPSLSSGVCVDFTADGRYLFFGQLFASPTIIDTSDWRILGDYYVADYPNAVDVSDDGKYVAFGDNAGDFIYVHSMGTLDDSFIYLPYLPEKQHGNVRVKPLIRYEVSQ